LIFQSPDMNVGKRS